MADPAWLLHRLKRQADGRHEVIAGTDAVAEIAAKLQSVIERHGPRSVVVYFGNGTIQAPFEPGLAASMLRAIGSPMLFNSTTIDKLWSRPRVHSVGPNAAV